MQIKHEFTLTSALALAPFLALPTVAAAATVANPLCPTNTAMYNPDNGKDIVVPEGFTVSVFAQGLNMPTGIAFLGNSKKFQVYVLESGHGLPSKCNEQESFGTGDFDPKNPFTPDIAVFDQSGVKVGTPIWQTKCGRNGLSSRGTGGRHRV